MQTMFIMMTATVATIQQETTELMYLFACIQLIISNCTSCPQLRVLYWLQYDNDVDVKSKKCRKCNFAEMQHTNPVLDPHN